MGRFYYLDKETLELKEGFPPPTVKVFGQAPSIHVDTCPPYYHPGVCRWTNSKSEIDQFDKACGTITTDKKQEPNRAYGREKERQAKQDRHAALHKAFAQVKAGTAPLTEEVRAKCRARNEVIKSATGVDWYKRLNVKPK